MHDAAARGRLQRQDTRGDYPWVPIVTVASLLQTIGTQGYSMVSLRLKLTLSHSPKKVSLLS